MKKIMVEELSGIISLRAHLTYSTIILDVKILRDLSSINEQNTNLLPASFFLQLSPDLIDKIII